MASQYDLKIKATLDDADVKSKLSKLGGPSGVRGAGKGGNVESAALTVNAAALARSLSILGREFEEISTNLGDSRLAKGISEFSHAMSNIAMLGRTLGGFGAALGLATTAVKLWSETVARARSAVQYGNEAAAEVLQNQEMQKRMEAYRGMNEQERSNARYQLTQQKSQYEDKIVDIAQKLASYGGDYDEYRTTLQGFIDGVLDNSALEKMFDDAVKQFGGAMPEDFLGNIGRYKDLIEFAQKEIGAIDQTLSLYDKVDREKGDKPAWDEIAPELRYAASRDGGDMGGGLAAIGGSLVGINTMESQLRELQEIRTLVGYMRNVLMEQGIVSVYD